MTIKHANYVISPEQANSKCYKNTLRQEIEIGRQADEMSMQTNRINQSEILAYKARILGNSNSYKEFADWTHFLISEYGPRQRCLSLGSGIGRVEKYLVSSHFTDKMETIELCANENESIRLKDTKINTISGDLNFIELPENSYDFVLCHGVLHHLINLEHVLSQINSSLKEDGIFLVYEYVGETRWQFTELRLHFLKNAFPNIKFNQRPAWRVNGFESVRSGELLDLIQSQFKGACERAVNYGGVYFPFIMCTSSKDDVEMKHVIKLDESISKDGSLAPCYHMGLYRKNNKSAIPVKQWTNSILESNLCPQTPLWYRFLDPIRQSSLGPFIRRVKRKIS